MKLTKFATPLVCSLGLAAFSPIQSVFAEEAFMVTGPLAYAWNANQDIGWNFISNGSYQITVVHDSSTPLSYTDQRDDFTWSEWSGAIKYVEYAVLDGNGIELFADVLEYKPDDIYTWYSDSRVFRSSYNKSRYGNRREGWNLANGYDNGIIVDFDLAELHWLDRYLSADELALERSESQEYPTPFDNVGYSHPDSFIATSKENRETYEWEERAIHGIIADVLDVDLDGDGILDSNDACPESDLGDTVIISGSDSGVENVLLESGCSIVDVITQIQEDDINHGAVVDGVSLFLNHLKDEGVLSGREKGRIQSTVARTNGNGNGNGKNN